MSKIELIYELIIKGIPLNNTTLIQQGINENEIAQILQEGILIKGDNNEYNLCCVYELYYYGLKLITKKEIKKAYQCFRVCYQLKPNDRIFLLQKLLSNLKLGHYNQVFEVFKIIEKTEPEKYYIDNNLYLYLLSMLTLCPEEYQERLYNIDYDSVLLPKDNQEYNKKRMNDIRHAIMKNKFGYAFQILNNIMVEEPIRIIEQEVLKELILQVIKSETKFKLKLLSFAKEQDYHLIVSYLNTKAKKKYLSNKETYIHIIAKTILEVLETNSPKEITVQNTKCLYESIKGNNFMLASQINNKMIKRENNPLDNQIISILLKDLNTLIMTMQQTNLEKQEIDKTESQEIDATERYLEESNNKQNINVDDKVIEDLAYILKQENIPIEVALKEKKITEEQALLIKLIYARDCYAEELYYFGDQLFQEVEKSKNKTPIVNQKLNEVRSNKKFYKYRKHSYQRKKL